MLYFLYEWLARSQEHVPALNLLKYLTFRTGMAMLTAYIVAVAMGSRFIRWMKSKQGKGQPIRTDGIARHVTEKSGTPTMGGFMILAGLFVGALLWADLRNIHVWVVLLITGSYGVLGFMDDYAKVTKQTTAGLSSVQKLIAQFVVAIIAAVLLILFAPRAEGGQTRGAELAPKSPRGVLRRRAHRVRGRRRAVELQLATPDARRLGERTRSGEWDELARARVVHGTARKGGLLLVVVLGRLVEPALVRVPLHDRTMAIDRVDEVLVDVHGLKELAGIVAHEPAARRLRWRVVPAPLPPFGTADVLPQRLNACHLVAPKPIDTDDHRVVDVKGVRPNAHSTVHPLATGAD